MSIESSARSNRVYRGGSWSLDPLYARVALRGSLAPGARRYFVGFRLMRRAS